MTTDDKLLEIIGELGAAVIQSVACDDQIIMEHVRKAHQQAIALRRELNRTGGNDA